MRLFLLVVGYAALALASAGQLRRGNASRPLVNGTTKTVLRWGNGKAHSVVVQKPSAGYGHPSWLQSCKEIYLDLGSNIGVQVRKLFEPEKYPGATVLPLFQQKFGAPDARRAPDSGICALGFEPNPEHTTRLLRLEHAYLDRGWHVHFYYMAVWSGNGVMTFKGNGENPAKRDWGAHLDMPAFHNATYAYDVDVPTVDISAFVRSLPAQSVRLMKMDIEGAEYECMSHLVEQNTLCASRIESAFVEAHHWGNVTNWPGDRSFPSMVHHVSSQDCKGPVTNLIDLDDESYLHDVDTDFGGSHPVVQ